MSLVAGSLAEWLRSTQLTQLGEIAGVRTKWGDLAIDSEVLSPYALRSDAAAEAARQAAFFNLPLAVETLEIAGRHSALVGQSRRIEADGPGFENSPAVFIIGAEERDSGSTLLTVLRRVSA